MLKREDVQKEVIPKDKLEDVLLLISRRRAASGMEVSSVLELGPSDSLSLVQKLLDKGLISGGQKYDTTAHLDQFYCLTEKGVKAVGAIEKIRKYLN